MQREKPKPRLIHKAWPLFTWCDCIVCMRQFRRESGWRMEITARDAMQPAPFRMTVFVCARCAPTRADVERDRLTYIQNMRPRAGIGLE